MRHVGHVSGEGGPLLVADANLVRVWGGARDGSGDYARACALFDGHDPEPDAVSIDIGPGHGILWELHGPGSADVYRSDDEIMLVRAWLDDEAALDALAEADGEQEQEIGELDVTSGAIALIWAPETGSVIDDDVIRRGGRPPDELTVEGTVFVVRVPPGRYHVWHDWVELEGGVARRCRIVA
jgi:hypothetical protein